MLFFNNKQLMEIDKKIDSVLDQLNISNHRQENILSKMDKIESKLELLEEQISNSHKNTSQYVQESKILIMKEINYLKEYLEILDSKIERLSENNSVTFIEKIQSVINEIKSVKVKILKSHEQSVTAMDKSFAYSSDLLQRLISDNRTINQVKIEKLTHELDKKLELVDSSLRLLLLNSVMNQIEW